MVNSPRRLTVHGATNTRTHAFERHIRQLAAEYPCLKIHIRYSDPSEADIEGNHHDSTGYVDIDLIKSLLSFDDYEFYMCGPPPFMESLYEGLKGLNVSDERIHFEFFGPGATLLREHPGETVGLATDLSDRPPVQVRFEKSGSMATWDPSKGTLLDLAKSAGLRPAYSCRSGICQTCTTKIIAGGVDCLESPNHLPKTTKWYSIFECPNPGGAYAPQCQQKQRRGILRKDNRLTGMALAALVLCYVPEGRAEIT